MHVAIRVHVLPWEIKNSNFLSCLWAKVHHLLHKCMQSFIVYYPVSVFWLSAAQVSSDDIRSEVVMLS